MIASGLLIHATRTPEGVEDVQTKLLSILGGGLLGLFEVNAEKPVELGRHQVPELRYPCWAAPILSDKRMVIRSEDYLICFDVAK